MAEGCLGMGDLAHVLIRPPVRAIPRLQLRKTNAAARKATTSAAPKTKAGTLIQAAVAEAKARQKAKQAEKKAAGPARAGGKAPAAAKHAGKGR